MLVRIDAAGICHSDLSVINGDRPRPMPMALGHEAAATILAVGAGHDPDFAVGDRVVLFFLPACGQCAACLSGEGYLCAAAAAANGKGELLRGGSRLSCDGQGVHHHLGVSAFATQAVVDRRSLVKIDRDIPPETAALFGCAVLTGVGAVMNTAKVRPGESVMIYGLGGVGLAALDGRAGIGRAAGLCGRSLARKARAGARTGRGPGGCPRRRSGSGGRRCRDRDGRQGGGAGHSLCHGAARRPHRHGRPAQSGRRPDRSMPCRWWPTARR